MNCAHAVKRPKHPMRLSHASCLRVDKSHGEDDVRLLIGTAAAAALLAGQAGAEPFRAAGADVQNAAALLTVIPEDRADIDVTVAPGSRLPAPTVRMAGTRVVIDGGLQGRLQGCGGWFQTGPRSAIRVAGVGSVPPDQLQRITLRVPRALDLNIGGGVHSTIGASNGGNVQLAGCGATEMADVSGALQVALNGSGDVRVAGVTGALDANLNGSGDLRVAHAGAGTALRLNGSGDLTVGDVGGALDARLAGSGDLRTGDIGGDAHLALVGSGDVGAGHVRGALSAQLNGSGDVTVASAAGPTTELRLDGSGDLVVHGGQTGQLNASNHGSGDVSFNGSARESRLEVRSSGDVSVANAGSVDQMTDTGSGAVHIGR
jgi:uncharacterized protein YaiE (UPF0345 family)